MNPRAAMRHSPLLENLLRTPRGCHLFPPEMRDIYDDSSISVTGQSQYRFLLELLEKNVAKCTEAPWDKSLRPEAVLLIQWNLLSLSERVRFSPAMMEDVLGFVEVNEGGREIRKREGGELVRQAYSEATHKGRRWYRAQGLRPYTLYRGMCEKKLVSARGTTRAINGLLLATDAQTRLPGSPRCLGNTQGDMAKRMIPSLRPAIRLEGVRRPEAASVYPCRFPAPLDPRLFLPERFPEKGFGLGFENPTIQLPNINRLFVPGGKTVDWRFRNFVEPLIEVSKRLMKDVQDTITGGCGFRLVTRCVTVPLLKDTHKKKPHSQKLAYKPWNRSTSEMSRKARQRAIIMHDLKVITLFRNSIFKLVSVHQLQFNPRGHYIRGDGEHPPRLVGEDETVAISVPLGTIVYDNACAYLDTSAGRHRYGKNFLDEVPRCLMAAAIKEFENNVKSLNAERDKPTKKGQLSLRKFSKLRRGSFGFSVPLSDFEALRRRWSLPESVVLERGRNDQGRYTLETNLTGLSHLSGDIDIIVNMGGVELQVQLGLPFMQRVCPPGEAPLSRFSFASLPAGSSKILLTSELPTRWNATDAERFNSGANQSMKSKDENVAEVSGLTEVTLLIPKRQNRALDSKVATLSQPRHVLLRRVKRKLAKISLRQSRRDNWLNARPSSTVTGQSQTLRSKAEKERAAILKDLNDAQELRAEVGGEDVPADLEAKEDEDAEHYGEELDVVIEKLEADLATVEKKIRGFDARASRDKDRLQTKMKQSFGVTLPSQDPLSISSMEKKRGRSKVRREKVSLKKKRDLSKVGRGKVSEEKLKERQRNMIEQRLLRKKKKHSAMQAKYPTEKSRKKFYARVMRKKIRL